MMSCLHVSQLSKLVPPTAFSKIYKEECTLCYVTPDHKDGLDVCLSCFNGACTNTANNHSHRHYRKTGHALVLSVRRTLISSGRDAEVQPAKLQKVEVVPDKEPEYEWSYVIKCMVCSTKWNVDSDDISGAHPTVNAIISSVSAQKRIDSQAWQEETLPCDHTRKLRQETIPLAHRIEARDKCSMCDMKENLWMCLTCGVIGCGRKQYDGSGGNGHGLDHFEETQHPAAVKLGTITPEGDSDVHCYPCSEMRVDPNLSEHLAIFGIDVASVEKTERTMAELQLEHNVKFDFSMVTDDGRQLECINGAGLTGLKNLGNSCYMSSVVQSLFSLSNFKKQYADQATEHFAGCQRDSPACFVCQASKLCSGLWDGEHTTISPWMFKSVVTSGHPEFSTARQQDASEFLAYLFKAIQRSDPVNAQSLVNPFTFGQQQQLVCTNCGDSRYQQVKSTQLSLQISDVLASSGDDITVADKLQLSQFLDKTLSSAETVEAKCSKCGGNEKNQSITLTSTPEFLVISLCRYLIRNWVPQKIEMSVSVPFQGLDLSPYLGTVTESAPEESESPIINQSILDGLLSMGFPVNKCKKAIIETNNAGLEEATNWIFEHMDDDDTVVEEEGTKGSSSSIPSEMISMLMDAGFNRDQAIRALKETDCNVERAFDWILSHPDESNNAPIPSPDITELKNCDSPIYDLVAFVSHKGPSIHCGHYISHVRHKSTGKWIMFNDERVAITDPQPPMAAAEKAYIYIYQRRQ